MRRPAMQGEGRKGERDEEADDCGRERRGEMKRPEMEGEKKGDGQCKGLERKRVMEERGERGTEMEMEKDAEHMT
jgi:hypothetical protein